jgi:hypothetical protein
MSSSGTGGVSMPGSDPIAGGTSTSEPDDPCTNDDMASDYSQDDVFGDMVDDQ